MIIGERIALIRNLRRLKCKQLAALSGISASELSYIESLARNPKTDTLQKIAAALEVTTSFLLGEVNGAISLEKALALESLKIFSEREFLTPDLEQVLTEIAKRGTGPQTTTGWKELLENFSVYNSSPVARNLRGFRK